MRVTSDAVAYSAPARIAELLLKLQVSAWRDMFMGLCGVRPLTPIAPKSDCAALPLKLLAFKEICNQQTNMLSPTY